MFLVLPLILVKPMDPLDMSHTLRELVNIVLVMFVALESSLSWKVTTFNTLLTTSKTMRLYSLQGLARIGVVH